MIYQIAWKNIYLLMAINMVLCGAVADAGDAIANASRVRRAPQPHYSHRVMPEKDDMNWKRLHWRQMQVILQREGSQKEGQMKESQKEGVECCPSFHDVAYKKGGRNRDGLYVELYEDGENHQQFFEQSCAKDVEGKPCRFVDARLYNDSVCVQTYSYSYALVRSPSDTPEHRSERPFSVPGTGGWTMDFVRVRAGCECQIKPPKNIRKRHKKRKRNRRIIEDDET